MDNPISNHLGLVFKDTLLPKGGPTNEPNSTVIAGIQAIFPLFQYNPTATSAVKIAVNNEVAIASCILRFNVRKKGGNSDPPLPPLIPVIVFKINAHPVTIGGEALILSEKLGAILYKFRPITVNIETVTKMIARIRGLNDK